MFHKFQILRLKDSNFKPYTLKLCVLHAFFGENSINHSKVSHRTSLQKSLFLICFNVLTECVCKS